MTITKVPIVERILNANDQIAKRNRARLVDAGVFSLNVMASPGAGKTSLILQTIRSLSSHMRIGVVEGDTAPVTIDADKVIAAGMPAVQINTGGECHLDANMLAGGIDQLNLDEIDLLIVENVGNLVCPAAFALGTDVNVVVASVPEGDDKPYKYPNIYRGIGALILNKVDLLPYINFDMDYFRRGVELLNPGVQWFPVSCKTQDGIDNWAAWLAERAIERKSHGK